MLLTVIYVLVALLFLSVAVIALYIAFQGDAVIQMLTEKKNQITSDVLTDKKAEFSFLVPFYNVGKQEGTILDAYMRIYLPQEQYSDVLLRGKVNLKGSLREDDYFEALLVPAKTGNSFVLRFEAYAKNGKTISEALKNIPDVDVALFADCRGRRELYTIKKYFTLTAQEMRALVK